MLDALLERYHRGERQALARLLTLLARGEHTAEIHSRIQHPSKPARVIALTGSAGVGKSSLVGKLIESFRTAGQTVAVLACDPQSPLSGGALLGDRFRMPSRPEDDGVFIRSLAAVSGHGAVAAHLDGQIRALEVFGFDVILVETVGAGQGDTSVRQLCDAVVLLLQPETGDDLQWEKAGILEVADLIVIHKADLPGAANVEAQVRATLGLSANRELLVMRVSSKTGEGVETLREAVLRLPLRRADRGDDAEDFLKMVLDAIEHRLARLQEQGDPRWGEMLQGWRQGRLSTEEAGTALLRLLAEQGGP